MGFDGLIVTQRVQRNLFPQEQHLEAATHSPLQGTSGRASALPCSLSLPPWHRQECARGCCPPMDRWIDGSMDRCGGLWDALRSHLLPHSRGGPCGPACPKALPGDQLCALSWSNPAPSRAGPARVPLWRVPSPSPVTERKQRRELDVPPEDADHPVPLGSHLGLLAMNVFNLARPINSHPPRLPPRPPGGPAGSAPWKLEAGLVSSLDV